MKDRKGHHLLGGKAQISTAPELQKLVKEIQEKKHLEKKQREAQAEERKRKANANVALQHWEAQQIKRYNEDMAPKQAATNGKIQDFKRGWGGSVGGLKMGVGKLLFNFCSGHAGSRETRCK